MEQPKQEPANHEFDRLFELVGTPQNAQLVARCEEVGRQGEAIQKLEAILCQVDAPYIGSYLSA